MRDGLGRASTGSGLVWLFTGGLFLFGQAIDLVLIPGMVREANLRTQLAARR